jgi:hypothetical protein
MIFLFNSQNNWFFEPSWRTEMRSTRRGVASITRSEQMNRKVLYEKMIRAHGTDAVAKGKLTGTTDTDYFYFLCPQCEGGGNQRMRILDYGQMPDEPFPYPELTPRAKSTFRMSFHLYCPECKLHTVVKLANDGFQSGKITDGSQFVHRVIGPNEEIK